MDNSNQVIQDPVPATHMLAFKGDTLSFSLSLARPQKGNAWIRTNTGHAETRQREIIREVEKGESRLGRDWFDLPMEQMNDTTFLITLPCCEVGHFEAKCFFLQDGKTGPVWPQGPNVVINVEPADTCCANIIYNAFVRQFGPNKKGGFFNPVHEDQIRFLDENGYAVIPPSGTFRSLITELDFITGELGCRIIQLLPIHPTPTTYGRMGRFGSPYAALSFTAVDPALAEFDPRATPLEQFMELVDAVHERHSKIFIDIAINHTGWAAGLHETHPLWLVRDPDGQIEVPGAWGVVWADLTSLDYSQKDLWCYMTDVFLTWCRRGVDGFRCDAGYMIPVNAWRYIVAGVREQYPDTIFLLEGLGGKISVARDILNKANFSWAYSELFQNYDRGQIEAYLPGANDIAKSDGNMIHFAETHDNARLAQHSTVFAHMRTALCALCSHQGGFGFTNGVEWYAIDKIDVHGAPSLNWGSETNQVGHIRRLNAILKGHPAFHDRTELKMIQAGEGNYIVLLRHHKPSGRKLLVVANLDDQHKTNGIWNVHEADVKGTDFVDLISEECVTISETNGQYICALDPGQVLCLTADRNDVDLVKRADTQTKGLPKRIIQQQLQAKALEVLRYYRGVGELGVFRPDLAVEQLSENPVEYCRSLNHFSHESRVITWQWPQDIRREVMVPPGHFLMVRADTFFQVRIMDENRCLSREESLPCRDGSFFTLFSPLPVPETHRSLVLKCSVYTPGKTLHNNGSICLLSRPGDAWVKRTWYRPDLLGAPLLLLGTNGRGGMLRAHASWGELASRYDALLAANMALSFPEDRWIMFARCRIWLVYQDFSQEICNDCIVSFSFGYKAGGFWQYKVPTGRGVHVLLNVYIRMVPEENSLQMVFFRDSAKGRDGMLADQALVKLILRPDIENRNFHETTKAYQGPEHRWAGAVQSDPNSFTFAPEPYHGLHLKISNGSFVREPEWQYMLHRPAEAERGLDPDTDLFSPGYFISSLKGGCAEELTARITGKKEQACPDAEFLVGKSDPKSFKNDPLYPLDEAMNFALDHYIVKREGLNTVIAGYPWFLDWGRDALIFVRGLIAAGKIREARAVLKQFGRFEQDGTLPNMIRGKDVGNRDTSDAPLWFVIACADLVRKEGNEDFLNNGCNGRIIRQILLSIGQAYAIGTPGGVRMDPESGLVFSPAHFTWMDTDHPAGTPREGYPIEIQALWCAALFFFGRIDPSGEAGNWKQIALKVRASVLDLFWLKEPGYLSDCLHAASGIPAGQAEPDDALRPNQLFALTLGAISEKNVCRSILASCEKLLVPGAIRSLADQPVQRPIPISFHGSALNDSHLPYQGKYSGDEDTKRKPAYHNGTAWTWLFPGFCEAWAKTYGNKGRKTALAWLASSVRLVNYGCVGHIPEILDGDYPHRQRGCDAQAWSASEVVRVWEYLKADH